MERTFPALDGLRAVSGHGDRRPPRRLPWRLCTETAFHLVLPLVAAALLRTVADPGRSPRPTAALGALALAGPERPVIHTAR